VPSPAAAKAPTAVADPETVWPRAKATQPSSTGSIGSEDGICIEELGGELPPATELVPPSSAAHQAHCGTETKDGAPQAGRSLPGLARLHRLHPKAHRTAALLLSAAFCDAAILAQNVAPALVDPAVGG
jgi:hypothetical protein